MVVTVYCLLLFVVLHASISTAAAAPVAVISDVDIDDQMTIR